MTSLYTPHFNIYCTIERRVSYAKPLIREEIPKRTYFFARTHVLIGELAPSPMSIFFYCLLFRSAGSVNDLGFVFGRSDSRWLACAHALRGYRLGAPIFFC